MIKYLLISVRPEWVYHILNGDKTIELRKVIPHWVLEDVAEGETVKCLIYCTKAMPYLAFDFNDYEVNGYPEPHCGYELYETKLALDFRNLDDLPLNGKIVAQFDLNTIEEITTKFVIDDIVCDNLLKKSMVPEIDFVNYKPKYAMYIDNLKMFDKPKELTEYYKNQTDEDGIVLTPYDSCQFSCFDYDNDYETCLDSFRLTKAPQNMMMAWGKDE